MLYELIYFGLHVQSYISIFSDIYSVELHYIYFPGISLAYRKVLLGRAGISRLAVLVQYSCVHDGSIPPLAFIICFT